MSNHTEKTLQDKTMRELAELWNSIAPAERRVKKFATKPGAIKRILQLEKELAELDNEPEGQPSPPLKKNKRKKPTPENKPDSAQENQRRRAIAASWDDPSVRERRCARRKVAVGETVYTSVHAAFADLGLPVNQHARFRKRLFDKGAATYVAEDGTEHAFIATNLNGEWPSE